MLQFSYGPAGATELRGQVFNLTTKMSKDCTTRIPEGFHTGRTKRQENNEDNTKKEERSSSSEDRSFEAGVSIGAKVGSIGGSLETKYSEKSSESMSSELGVETFVSSVENVDNSYTFEPTDPPTLHATFKRNVHELIELHSASGFHPSHLDTIDRKILKMFSNYGSFLKFAELGSKYEEVRVISREALSKASKKETDFSVKASFQSAFASGSASYGQGEGFSEAEKSVFDSTETMRLQVGSNLREGGNFDPTDTPGVIKGAFGPICELFADIFFSDSQNPPPPSLPYVRQRCFALHASKAHCFANLERAETEKQIVESFVNVRKNLAHCNDISAPAVGFQFPRKFEAWLDGSSADTPGRCAMECFDRNGLSWFWNEGRCKICRDSKSFHLSFPLIFSSGQCSDLVGFVRRQFNNENIDVTYRFESRYSNCNVGIQLLPPFCRQLERSTRQGVSVAGIFENRQYPLPHPVFLPQGSLVVADIVGGDGKPPSFDTNFVDREMFVDFAREFLRSQGKTFSADKLSQEDLLTKILAGSFRFVHDVTRDLRTVFGRGRDVLNHVLTLRVDAAQSVLDENDRIVREGGKDDRENPPDVSQWVSLKRFLRRVHFQIGVIKTAIAGRDERLFNDLDKNGDQLLNPLLNTLTVLRSFALARKQEQFPDLPVHVSWLFMLHDIVNATHHFFRSLPPTFTANCPSHDSPKCAAAALQASFNLFNATRRSSTRVRGWYNRGKQISDMFRAFESHEHAIERMHQAVLTESLNEKCGDSCEEAGPNCDAVQIIIEPKRNENGSFVDLTGIAQRGFVTKDEEEEVGFTGTCINLGPDIFILKAARDKNTLGGGALLLF